MAKEKQKPYEFLSNLVLALMDTDSAFINAFFMDEFAISSKTLGGIRRGEDMCILSVCTSDPVYDEVSSFNDSAGYVAERIKNCTIFQL